MHPIASLARRFLLLALAALLLAGCFGGGPRLMPAPNLYAGQSPEEVFGHVPEGLQEPDMRILFATDRFPEARRANDPIMFGAERSSHLRVGSVRVKVEDVDDWQELTEASLKTGLKRRPRLTVGEPQIFFRYPGTFWRSVRIDDPSRDYEEFMERRMASREQLHLLVDDWLAHTDTKEAFVFIHGYNNSFDQAVVTAANIWHFMGKQGVPIAYTWPAGLGGLRGYTADSESGEFTIFHLKLFLEDLASNPEIETINILAHSRGTEVTMTAVRELAIAERAAGRNPNETLKLGTVILASPDIDMEVASQRISSERLPEVADKITMYISPKDRALRLSNWFHNAVSRLGGVDVDKLTPEQFQAVSYFKNLEIVDFRLKSDFIGHGYFYHNPSASSDVILTLRDKLDAGAETGRPLMRLGPSVYRLEEGYPNVQKGWLPGFLTPATK